MISLFVNYFISDNVERQEEYDYCIKMNQSNPFIDRIVFVFPKDLGNNRPTFDDYLDKIRDVSNEEDINIISNMDIFFDHTLSLALNIDKDTVYAISRWEIERDGSKSMFYNVGGSQDSWIFRGIPRKDLRGDIRIGVGGCDNRFAHYLINEAKYRVINPGKFIHANHVHKSSYRTYVKSDTIGRPWSDVPVVSDVKEL